MWRWPGTSNNTYILCFHIITPPVYPRSFITTCWRYIIYPKIQYPVHIMPEVITHSLRAEITTINITWIHISHIRRISTQLYTAQLYKKSSQRTPLARSQGKVMGRILSVQSLIYFCWCSCSVICSNMIYLTVVQLHRCIFSPLRVSLKSKVEI